MTTYAEFLNRKHARVETPGREVSPQDVHPMLHDWQNELVRWAVRTSRAALWADTGMVESRCGPSEVHLRNLRDRVPDVACTPPARARQVLLKAMRRDRQEDWIDTALRHVRCTLLSTPRRARCWGEDQPVLLPSVLQRVARGEHGRRHISQVGATTSASDSRRADTWAGALARRGCASHRPEQTQFRSVESSRVPRPVISRALPLRGDAR